MNQVMRLFLVAIALAFVASIGSVGAAAAELILLVPIAAYQRKRGSDMVDNPNFKSWGLGTAMFLVSVLICSPLAYPWDTIGLALFSPLFGLIVAGIDPMFVNCVSRKTDASGTRL